MASKHTGGCQCGAVRYAIHAEPTTVYCCHCTDCQQQASSAFGMSVWFPAQAFTLTSGAVSTWVTKADSGVDKHCAFCVECGTRLYHGSADVDDVLSVKGGTLDGIGALVPVAHIWTKSAQRWLLPQLDARMCYDRDPADFDDLVKAFAQSR